MAWRVVQYAGRLHRKHAGKTEVRIHDYRDEEGSVLGADGAPLLQEGKNDEPLLRYANWSGYTKATIMPVKFEKPEGASQDEVADLQKLADSMHAALARDLGQYLEIATEPGPDTLRVEATIYDAQKKNTVLNAFTGIFPVGIVVNAAVRSSR